MPIAKLTPTAAGPQELDLPQIEPKSYEGVVNDLRSTPIDALLAYVEGAPWTATYYSQIVAKHNDLKDYDPNEPGLYQAYQKIEQLELRVVDDLKGNYDNSTGISQVQGSAYIPNAVIPNVGDVFVAEMDSGDRGVFRVTVVERRTYNRRSVFYIEYILYKNLSQEPQFIEGIEAKVARVFYFSKDRLIAGLAPLVIPSEYEALDRLDAKNTEIVQYYFKSFFNRAYHALVLPGQLDALYDPLLVEFLLKITNTDEALERRLISSFGEPEDAYLAQPTIWTALLAQDLGYLEVANRKMGWVSSRVFFSIPQASSLRYQKMDYILYPISPDVSLRSAENPQPHEVIRYNLTPTKSAPLHTLLYQQITLENATIPLLPIPFQNDDYVVNEGFYDLTPQSYLERLMLRYLRREAIDAKSLLQLVQHYRHWNRLEQFYYLPVALFLMRRVLGAL